MKEVASKILFEGRWLTVEEISYVNPHGETVRWERVVRKNTGTGMVVIARLMPSKRFVLIKQYRAAVNGYILGLPAGLADGNPNDAIKELKEETGYSGRIVDVSPVLKAGSGVVNDTGMVVVMEVDENLPENRDPAQKLEAAEEIEVVLVTREQARARLLQALDEGVHVSSGLWYLFGLDGILKT